eukprot:s7815_g4.t2
MFCRSCLLVWALVSWNREYQDAVREAGDWFYSIVARTSNHGPIVEDWDGWSDLIRTQPGKWKGMIRRAEAWDVELGSLAPAAGLEHGCLLCGLALASQQQWGAHAQRVHGYRNAAARLAKGRRRGACGSMYASESGLKNHLLYSARCRNQLEAGLVSPGVVPVDGVGHVQAPVVRDVARHTLPIADGAPISRPRLAALQALVEADDQAVYDLTVSYVEPLPTLPDTLSLWLRGLPDGPLAAAGSDVLLVILHPEHICSAVCGRLPDQQTERTFVPDVVAPMYRPPTVNLPVLFSGHLDLAWSERWSLGEFPARAVSSDELPSACAACNGVCFSVSGPPCDDACLFSPSCKPLRALREHCAWVKQTATCCPWAASLLC